MTGIDSVGTLRLDLTSTVGLTDIAGNPLVTLPFNTGEVYDITTPGRVNAITRDNPSPTNAGSVSWTVLFNQPVSDVTAANFTLVPDPTVTGASITNVVAGAGFTFIVTASTGTGDGTLGLNFTDSNGTTPPITNGPFAGELYTLDRTVPIVNSINRVTGPETNDSSVQWTVVFSEAVDFLQLANFSLVFGGTLNGVAVDSFSGSGTTWTVTATTGTGDGPLGLNLSSPGGIRDLALNELNSPFVGEEYTIDRTAPVVDTVALIGPAITNATSVSWSVTFSEPITGLSASNFTLAAVGVAGATITSVIGSGTAWTVVADTGMLDGTLGLNVTSTGGVFDVAGNQMTGASITGPLFTIDKTAPQVVSILLDGPALTNAASVSWTVTFNEAMTSVTAANFALNAVGVPGAAITNVAGFGTTWVVTASTGTGDGTLGLDAVAPATATDIAGEAALTGLSVFGPEYTFDRVSPQLDNHRSVDGRVNELCCRELGCHVQRANCGSVSLEFQRVRHWCKWGSGDVGHWRRDHIYSDRHDRHGRWHAHADIRQHDRGHGRCGQFDSGGAD